MDSDDWDAYERVPGGVPKRLGLVNATAEIRVCACGVEIVVTHRREHDIMAAILTHSETPEHKAWRAWRRIP